MLLISICSAITSSWNLDRGTLSVLFLLCIFFSGCVVEICFFGFSARNLCTDLQPVQISLPGILSVIERIQCLVSDLHRPHGASSSWPA